MTIGRQPSAGLGSGQEWNTAWGIVPGGFASIAANQAGITAAADITGLTVTFNAIPGRTYKITAAVRCLNSTADAVNVITCTDSTPTTKREWRYFATSTTNGHDYVGEYKETGLSGSITRKLRAQALTGSLTIVASATVISSIQVEDIGPS